ncbi:MAG: RNA 2',3'-cyclic phosphodiesterase [Chromatocurvus sp.]
MRVFFGIEPDPAACQTIADWRDRYGIAAGRPVPSANFHITLAFVGDVSDRQLETLCTAVDERQDGDAFVAGELELDLVGFWPGAGIYWMGASQPPRQLAALARKLQHLGGLVGARLQKKPFTPHVTLYRNCSDPPPAPAVPPKIDLDYTYLTLFESKPGREGVSYHALAQWDLTPASGLP